MRVLSAIVIMYMLLALVWWTILLYTKNDEIYQLKKQAIQLDIDKTYGVQGFDLADVPDYQTITAHHKKQGLMVMGEGMVFGLSLMLGIWFIQRSFIRELKASERQNNFLLSITHELKSPLTSINLCLETLKKRVMNHDMVKDLSETALGESKRLENLINNLLMATKVDHSYDYHMKVVDLNELTSDKINAYQRTMPEKEIIFQKSSTPIFVKADQASFEIILSNLVDNAIKYGDNTPINISLNIESDFAILDVKDQGTTIPEKHRQEIFQKFVRLGSEETRKTKGTGLGLYIVKKMLEAHNAKITVKENKPRGNIFEIKIPLA